MSRTPFWQPGDRWQPPVIRFKGVDEKSPVGQQLLQAYGARIKQFYLGQARAHSLGITDNSRGTRQFPDAKMTYTQMMGQEIVEVEVRPELVEGVEQKVSKRGLPDWLLVEFVVEDGSRIKSDFTAFARTPDWRTLDAGAGGTNTNTNLKQGHWGSWGASAYTRDGRLVSGISVANAGYTPNNSATVIERGAQHRNTFVVDLRRLRNWPVLAFDFYGWVTSEVYYLNLITYTRVSPPTAGAQEYWGGYVIWEVGGGNGPVTESNLIGVVVGDSIGTALNKYLAALNALHTSATPDMIPATKDTPDTVETWGLTGNGNGGPITDLGGGLKRMDVDNTWSQTFWTYTPTYELAVAARDVTLDVRHNIFTGGNLVWRQSFWQHLNDGPVTFSEVPDAPFYPYEQSFSTWEHPNFNTASLPTQHLTFSGVTSLAPTDVPPFNLDVSNHYNRPYFGTYTLAQEEWSGSWSTPGAGP